MERSLLEVDMQEHEAQRTATEFRRSHDAAALDRTIEREIIPRLKSLGAEGIVEYPLNKIVH